MWSRTPKTDDKIIEETRKSLKASKWLSALYLGLALLMLIAIIRFAGLFIDLFEMLGPEKSKAWLGFAVGIVAALVIMPLMFSMFHAIGQSIENLMGRRKDRLLIKYHDALAELAKRQKNFEPGP